jgi:predicted dithiol-disulfide oxidoreductase (DUF899 family)
MDSPEVVTQSEWLEARKALLAREKELTRLRDELSAERRRLPMVEIEKDYRFTGPDGEVGLADLFEGRGQLLIYHFMWLADQGAGCPSCSFLVDNIGDVRHLHARDTTLALVARGPFEDIDGYRRRMGWNIPLYSSLGSDFNYDFHVTIDSDVAPVEYNYRGGAELAKDPAWRDWKGEMPGTSAFLREGDRVFHTYSSYARAGDIQIGTYNWLDLTARGRQEKWEQPPGRNDGSRGMEWLRRHDEYPASNTRAAG